MKTIFACAVVALTLCNCARGDMFGTGVNQFRINFVTVGNPGNDADTDDGDAFSPGSQHYGAVAYLFRMGELEISERMIDIVNAQSTLGITRDNRGATKPATGITWLEAASFANWLNTSSGGTPAYKFDAGGFAIWQPGDPGYDATNLYRNKLAKYFLPSIDEWYKAAYYNPAGANYFDYPTGSDNAPTPVADGISEGTAVYLQSTSQGPANFTAAGGLSPYGTMAQAGNVSEWVESSEYGVSSNRALRGGNWMLDATFFDVSWQGTSISTDVSNERGFRIAATVPEPSVLGLFAVGALAALANTRARFYRNTR